MDNRQNAIDRYLNRRMSEEMRQEFEAEMASDPSLRKEVDETRRMIRAIGDVARCQQSLSRWEKQRRERTTIKQRNILWPAVSVAAAACVVIALFVSPALKDSDSIVCSANYGAYVADNAAGGVSKEPVSFDDDLVYDYAGAATESLEFDDNPTVDTPDTGLDEKQWSEVMRLIKADSISKALPMLTKFASEPGIHRSEANKILTEIKKRNN